MSLLESIKLDQLNARKARDATKAQVLTTLIGEIEGELTRLKPEDRVAKVNSICISKVKQFLDKINENLVIAEERNDQDWKTVLVAETVAIAGYMPVQLDKSALKRVLTQAGIENPNKGLLMKFLKDNFAGQYDGKLAAQVVDEFLTK
jgi:uncharacterized protein YqeY